MESSVPHGALFSCPFDYQSDRHCSKTNQGVLRRGVEFDYQSDRHCFKTSAGIRVKARPKKALGISGKELQGVSNPDIEIDGMMWEIKSPYDIGKEQSACELRVINNALKDSERNFRNPYDYIKRCGSGNLTIGRRVILNERYKRMDADRLASEDEIKKSMKTYKVEELIIVTRDGDIKRYISK